MPVLSRDLDIVLPGDVYPTTLRRGEAVKGEAARVAAELGALAPPPPDEVAPEKKVEPPAPEKKIEPRPKSGGKG